MVCKWPCLSEMQRLLCTLSRCVGALHFFGLRCLLSNFGWLSRCNNPCRCWLVWSFLFSPLHTHTNTHRTQKFRVWQHDRLFSFISSSGRTSVRIISFRPWLSTITAFGNPFPSWKDGPWSGASSLYSVKNTTTCYNTKLTLNCLVLWLDLLACQTLY